MAAHRPASVPERIRERKKAPPPRDALRVTVSEPPCPVPFLHLAELPLLRRWQVAEENLEGKGRGRLPRRDGLAP